ncbi:Protein of unknown function [Bacillus wiedmannii]|nr:Protein of unknown function [Bacillus wiedmannii]
MAETRPGG